MTERLSALASLLWAGMSLGIVHDAAVKFSTPEVPRLMLLRVGMHLFRSYRAVELILAAILAALQMRSAWSLSRGVNRPLAAAVVLSLVRSYVYPIPLLLREGDCTIAGHGTCQDQSLQAAAGLAHAAVVSTELLKIGLLVWGAATSSKHRKHS
eukprot:TRINITY_DN64240_c0_g1_i1.p1 TRINITY_DN64240_c0_g1~~TRINITY_DN64240_c0_g1_i1.p1  ORF type:complete len:154 (+),score=27.82 TRINITY_DN64240_c0_g1_i1:74-535(+)